MSRTQVIEIRSDMSRAAFYATDDGKTDQPFTYKNDAGEEIGADLMPNEKAALYAALTGDTAALYDILKALQPKVQRGSATTDERRNTVAQWVEDTTGKRPGRVTQQMEDKFDAHMAALEAAAKADDANAAKTPPSRNSKRNADANA